jgi:hypothetical protein
MGTERDTQGTTAAPARVYADAPAATAAAVRAPTAGSSATASPAIDREPGISSPPDPYAAILELAEHELQLARDGRIEDLRSLAPTWDALTAGLPERPPASARTPLERAAALHERTSATLQCLREALLCDLRTTARASRAAHGYAGQVHRRVHRMDHSA